jgi:hypothetical protein
MRADVRHTAMDLRSTRTIALIAVVMTVAGCATTASPEPPAARSPSAAASPDETEPTISPATSPAASASSNPAFGPNDVVSTVVDRVRVRSLPAISDASTMFEPLLPAGAKLVVLTGPVEADGYSWYEIAPITTTGLQVRHGWVAAGSREGQPWLGPSTTVCPSPPEDLAGLRALTPGERIACFSGQPLQVKARIVSCNCDIDGPIVEPGWFGVGGQANLLVTPDQTKAPTNPGDWFFLAIDPEAEQPATLPVGKVVDVTGMFDHPAALDCQVAGMDEPLKPSSDCRFDFAVTRLALAS